MRAGRRISRRIHLEGIRQRESSRTSKTILVAPRTCAVTTREVLLYKSRTWYIYALPFAHASRVCIYRSPYLRWCVCVGCWLWFGVGVFLCVSSCIVPGSQRFNGSIRPNEQGIVLNSIRVPDSIEFGVACAHGILLPLIKHIEVNLGCIKVHESSAWSCLLRTRLEGLRELGSAFTV